MTEISTSLILVVFFLHDVIYSRGFSTLPGPVHDLPTWTLREHCKGHRGPLDQVPQPFSSLNSFEVTSVHNRNLAWLHPAASTDWNCTPLSWLASWALLVYMEDIPSTILCKMSQYSIWRPLAMAYFGDPEGFDGLWTCLNPRLEVSRHTLAQLRTISAIFHAAFHAYSCRRSPPRLSGASGVTVSTQVRISCPGFTGFICYQLLS